MRLLVGTGQIICLLLKLVTLSNQIFGDGCQHSQNRFSSSQVSKQTTTVKTKCVHCNKKLSTENMGTSCCQCRLQVGQLSSPKIEWELCVTIKQYGLSESRGDLEFVRVQVIRLFLSSAPVSSDHMNGLWEEGLSVRR